MLRLALVAVLTLSACGSSVAGTAAGHCRIRYGYHGDDGPPIADQERTDQVTLTITEQPDHTVRIRGAGCDLLGTRDDAEGEYTITSGSCDMNVPGAGQRTFPVRYVPRSQTHTDGPGEVQAYLIVHGSDVELGFTAAIAPGDVRCDCDLVKH